jgi:hypothetical protein
MARRGWARSALLVAVLCSIVIPAGGCAPYGSEQLLLERFFALSRLRDRTALQRISTVVFEPRADGIVTDFSIIAVTQDPGGTSKRVTVDAVVRPPEGDAGRRRIVLLLERRDRWIVTGFTVRRP